MKLSEITKKEFLSRLKDPHKALIRHNIKEIRKLIKPKGWTLQSTYNKNTDIFMLFFQNEYNNLNTNVYMYTEQNIIKKSEIIKDIWTLFPSDLDIMIEESDNQSIILKVKGTKTND